MIRDALLALGIVMAVATQINVPGLPFTVGQFALLLWIGLSVGQIVMGGQLVVTPALRRLGFFWFALTIGLCVGMIAGSLSSILYAEDILHDTFAYVFLAMLTCLSMAETDSSRHLRRCAWFVVGVSNVVLAIQVGFAWDLISQPGVTPWHWDRLQGWSENPNQLALYCALFGPIALHLATTTRWTYGRIFGFGGLVLPFYVGLLTKSDTFLFTAILGYLVFLTLRFRDWFSWRRSNLGSWHQITLLSVLTTVLIALTLIPFAIREADSIQSFAIGLTRKGERTDETVAIRVQLAEEAITTGLRSASLGLGPGPHLERPGLRADHVAFEAHNVVLEFYVQGGLIAVLSLFWLIGSAARSTWRAKQDALVALIVLLIVFGLTHVIFRHPLVWFCITLCLATEVKKVDSTRASQLEATSTRLSKGPPGAITAMRSLC